MSNLSAFLKPAYTEKKIEIVVSDRFNDENGNPVPIVMKSLTQEQLNAIAKQSTHEKKIGNKTVYDLDANEHLNRCLIASIVFPDLTNTELCRAYGTIDPVTLPPKMFLVNEYEMIAKAFAQLNGLKNEDGSIQVAGEITKN
jgi:hypothetical protein